MWMQTFLGNDFVFEEPENIQIEDIAHSLGNLCRFGGHCRPFYSVADHSLHVSQRCKHKLWGLLHDASEAYIGDIIQPFKYNPRWYPFLKQLETIIEKVIAKKFNLPWPMPDEIKMVDARMWATEQRDLMNQPNFDWEINIEPYPGKIISRGFVGDLFLRRFYMLSDTSLGR